MKCFNHYGGYLCLPRSAHVVTAPESSSQSEPSVPVETNEAFNPCPVGYRAQGETCVGELFKGRCGKSYSYGFRLNMCISVAYRSSSSFRGLCVCVLDRHWWVWTGHAWLPAQPAVHQHCGHLHLSVPWRLQQDWHRVCRWEKKWSVLTSVFKIWMCL